MSQTVEEAYLLPLKLQLIAGKRGFQREFQRKICGQGLFASEWVNFVEGQRVMIIFDRFSRAKKW